MINAVEKLNTPRKISISMLIISKFCLNFKEKYFLIRVLKL